MQNDNIYDTMDNSIDECIAKLSQFKNNIKKIKNDYNTLKSIFNPKKIKNDKQQYSADTDKLSECCKNANNISYVVIKLKTFSKVFDERNNIQKIIEVLYILFSKDITDLILSMCNSYFRIKFKDYAPYLLYDIHCSHLYEINKS